MIVLLAGAGGAVGARAGALLRAAGHSVVDVSRRSHGLGDRHLTCDLTRPDAVRALVRQERPDVIVDLITDLGDCFRTVTLGRAYARDRRTRTAVTKNLIAAAESSGVRRWVTQTVAFTAMPASSPGQAADETGGLLTRAPHPLSTLLSTQELVERAAADTSVPESAILRFGYLYGPGTWWAPDGAYTSAVRQGRFPLIGSGNGHWPWLHVDDAAAAVVAAVTSTSTGIFNIAEPACPATRDWLPTLARALGARSPRRVPAWVARALGAGAAAHLSDRAPRLSMQKAQVMLPWTAARTWQPAIVAS